MAKAMANSSDREIQQLLNRREFTKAETMIRQRLDDDPKSAEPRPPYIPHTAPRVVKRRQNSE